MERKKCKESIQQQSVANASRIRCENVVKMLILISIFCLVSANTTRNGRRTLSIAAATPPTAANVPETTARPSAPKANGKAVDDPMVIHVSNSILSRLSSFPSERPLTSIVSKKKGKRASMKTLKTSSAAKMSSAPSHTALILIQSAKHAELTAIRDQYRQFADTFGVQLRNITMDFDSIDGKCNHPAGRPISFIGCWFWIETTRCGKSSRFARNSRLPVSMLNQLRCNRSRCARTSSHVSPGCVKAEAILSLVRGAPD